MDVQDARNFLTRNHRAVLVTPRSGGRVQTSPVVTAIDDQGRAVISSRETAFKVKNLRRDPSATLCVFTDRFFGDWMQVDGTAEVVSLPDAMDGLVDYYRRVAGEHDNWDEYRAAMEREQRVLIRITIQHVGPDRSG